MHCNPFIQGAAIHPLSRVSRRFTVDPLRSPTQPPYPTDPRTPPFALVCRSGRARLQRQEPCRGRPRSTRDIWERAFNGRWPEKAARLFTREDHYHDWTFLYLSFHSQFHDDHFVLAMPEEHLLRQPAEAVFENPRVLARFEAAAEEWIFLIEEALEEIAARYVVPPTVVLLIPGSR